jgi:hypothetical protein
VPVDGGPRVLGAHRLRRNETVVCVLAIAAAGAMLAVTAVR